MITAFWFKYNVTLSIMHMRCTLKNLSLLYPLKKRFHFQEQKKLWPQKGAYHYTAVKKLIDIMMHRKSFGKITRHIMK